MKPVNHNIIFKKVIIAVPNGNCTKTSENQDLNDFLQETLAWINYHRQQLIPNNKELSLFPKICSFRASCCIGKLFLSENA